MLFFDLLRAGKRKVKLLYLEWRTRLFGPASKFKIGDRVKPLSGGKYMLVTEIISFRHMKEPLIQCKWYDPETFETRTNIFPESKLQVFDGYIPKKQKQRIRYTTSELVSL